MAYSVNRMGMGGRRFPWMRPRGGVANRRRTPTHQAWKTRTGARMGPRRAAKIAARRDAKRATGLVARNARAFAASKGQRTGSRVMRHFGPNKSAPVSTMKHWGNRKYTNPRVKSGIRRPGETNYYWLKTRR